MYTQLVFSVTMSCLEEKKVKSELKEEQEEGEKGEGVEEEEGCPVV